MTPLLVGRPRGLDQSQPTRPDVSQLGSKPLVAPSRAEDDSDRPRREVNVPIVEQFIQLDEVVITNTNDDMDVTEKMPAGKVFDRSAAVSAIRSAAARLAGCGPAAVGSMNVIVTFASSGQTTSVELEDGTLQGTPEGSCVAHHLRDLRVPVFCGEQETVRTTLVVE